MMKFRRGSMWCLCYALKGGVFHVGGKVEDARWQLEKSDYDVIVQ